MVTNYIILRHSDSLFLCHLSLEYMTKLLFFLRHQWRKFGKALWACTDPFRLPVCYIVSVNLIILYFAVQLFVPQNTSTVCDKAVFINWVYLNQFFVGTQLLLSSFFSAIIKNMSHLGVPIIQDVSNVYNMSVCCQPLPSD